MIIRQHTYKLLLLLAAGWFAACSQDDDISAGVPDTPSAEAQPMTFGGSLDEAQDETSPAKTGQQSGSRATTRATDLEDVATSFTVYGKKAMAVNDNNTPTNYVDDVYSSTQNVFIKYAVNYDDATGWTYTNVPGQTVKYWDMDAEAYMFAAYAYDKGAPTPTAVTANYAVGDRITFNFEAMCYTDDEIKNTPYVSKKWFSNGTPGSPQFGAPVELTFSSPSVRCASC